MDALSTSHNINEPGANRGRGFTRLWAAVGVSTLGDGAFLAALPLAAAAVTRNPTSIAAVSAASFLPWVLVQPVAGALMDRWPHRTVMIISDLARAVGMILLTLLVVLDNATIPALATIACLTVTGQIFHDTAVQSVVPVLVGHDGTELDRANGRIYGTETAGKQLLGPPAGSLSYVLTPWVPFAAAAASFIASAALISRLPATPAAQPSTTVRKLLPAVKAGVVWLARHRQLRSLALIAAAANIAYHLSWATFVLLATDEDGLAVTPAAFGLMLAAYAVGGVIGGPLTAMINKKVGAVNAILGLTLIHALIWPLIALTSSVWMAVPGLALIGLAQTVLTTTNAGLRQRLVPSDMLSRVISAFRWVVNAPTPLAALAGGLIAGAYGLGAPMVVAGAFLLTAVVLIASTKR